MKTMYIVVKDKEIIAAHEDIEVVTDYIINQEDSQAFKVLKVKKSKTRELERIPDFEEIYLVRYGEYYVPFAQYNALKELNGQRDFDLRYCRDILLRLLEENVVGKKDIPAFKKILSIVMNEIEFLEDNDFETLEKIKDQLREVSL